jgi:hypothetical protein
MPYKKFKEQKAAKADAETAQLSEAAKVGSSKSPLNGTNGTAGSTSDATNGHEEGGKEAAREEDGDSDVMEVDRPEPTTARGHDAAAVQLEMEMRGPRVNGNADSALSQPAAANGTHS